MNLDKLWKNLSTGKIQFFGENNLFLIFIPLSLSFILSSRSLLASVVTKDIIKGNCRILSLLSLF
jgi:hypothetical protein